MIHPMESRSYERKSILFIPHATNTIDEVFHNRASALSTKPSDKLFVFYPQSLTSLCRLGIFLFPAKEGDLGSSGFVISSEDSLTATNIQKNREICEELQQGKDNFSEDVLKEINETMTDLSFSGIELSVGSANDNFVIGVHPKMQENFMEAMSVLQELLHEENFWKKQPEEILEHLQQAHVLLWQNSSYKNGGKIRDVPCCIVENDTSFSPMPKKIENAIQKSNLSQKNQQLLKSTIQKFIKEESVNAEELQLAKTAGIIIMPNPADLMSKMRVFIQHLQQMHTVMLCQGKVNFVKLAAFAHNALINIHLFEDGNGRIARAFANAIVMSGGLAPMFFPSEETYTQAVKSGDESLESYMQERIKKTIEYLNKI